MGVGCSVGGGRERFVSRIRRSKTIGARKEVRIRVVCISLLLKIASVGGVWLVVN